MDFFISFHQQHNWNCHEIVINFPKLLKNPFISRGTHQPHQSEQISSGTPYERTGGGRVLERSPRPRVSGARPKINTTIPDVLPIGKVEERSRPLEAKTRPRSQVRKRPVAKSSRCVNRQPAECSIALPVTSWDKIRIGSL